MLLFSECKGTDFHFLWQYPFFVKLPVGVGILCSAHTHIVFLIPIFLVQILRCGYALCSCQYQRELYPLKSILRYFVKYPKILCQVSLPSFFAQNHWMKKSLVKTLMLMTDWGLKRCNVGELFCNYI